MPIFERSIDIDAPLETVFAFHLDTRNVPRITPPTQQVTQIEGTFPLVLGAEVQMLLRQDPIPTAQPWKIRVTALEEPTLIVDELVDNPNFVHFVHTHRFASSPTGGTTLTDQIDWEMPNSMAGRMATPIAKGILEKVFTARQERTKALLEADMTSARS
jgi:ligand-binding SRPBCC domain-containing protein